MTMDNGCKEEMDFADAKSLAQIVSGSAFFFLAFWMIFANTSKISVARRADLSQRYTIAVTICTAVTLFSGFFNILQLTKIQQFALPRPTQYTVDLARPVEWICTCPILQLALVILGGTRIPSYRRFMMPLMAVAILLCGTASMFTESALRWAWYAFSFILMLILFYHNILQISENSDGAEGLFRGSSDFSVLTRLLLALWFPFPFWFFLSPEGFGVIKDILVVNLGWAVLNIVAKFSFIIYLQLAKMRYTARKEAAQELYAVQPAPDAPPADKVAAWPALENGPEQTPGGYDQGRGYQGYYGEGQGYSNIGVPKPQMSEKLTVLVTEAMVTMGLSQHTDRFLTLLEEQGITSLDALEKLNADRCMDLGLPYNLVSATQKRWVSEKMTLADELDGTDVDTAAAVAALAAPPPQNPMGHDGPWRAHYPQGPPSHRGFPQGPPSMGYGEDRLRNIENALQRLLEKVDSSRDAVLAKIPGNEKMEPAEFMHVGERLAIMMQKMEANREEMVRHVERAKEDVLQNVSREIRAVNAQVEASRADVVEQLRRHSDQQRDELVEKLATYKVDILEKISASEEHILQRVVLVGQNVELSKEVFLQRTNFQEGATQKMDGWKQDLLAKMEAANMQVQQKISTALDQALGLKDEVVGAVNTAKDSLHRSIETTRGDLLQKADAAESMQETSRREAEAKHSLLLSKMEVQQDALQRSQGDVDTRITTFLTRVQCDTEKHQRSFASHLGEILDKLLRALEDHMVDIRRMNMMVMENVNSAQERAQASIDVMANRVSSLTPVRESSRIFSGGRHEEDPASDIGSVAGSGRYADHTEGYAHPE